MYIDQNDIPAGKSLLGLHIFSLLFKVKIHSDIITVLKKKKKIKTFTSGIL